MPISLRTELYKPETETCIQDENCPIQYCISVSLKIFLVFIKLFGVILEINVNVFIMFACACVNTVENISNYIKMHFYVNILITDVIIYLFIINSDIF